MTDKPRPPFLRFATANDAKPLSAFAIDCYRTAFGHSFSPADLADHLRDTLSEEVVARWFGLDWVVVAEEGVQIVGFAQYGLAPEEMPGWTMGAMELRRLYVHPAIQGKGLGTQLLKRVLADPTIAASPSLLLDVWAFNPRARRLYERFGFQVIGEHALDLPSGPSDSVDLVMALDQPGVEASER